MVSVPLSKVSTCKNKVRYRDHLEAVRMLHKLSRVRAFDELIGLESRRREVRDYSCDRCNGFHITSWA